MCELEQTAKASLLPKWLKKKKRHVKSEDFMYKFYPLESK